MVTFASLDGWVGMVMNKGIFWGSCAVFRAEPPGELSRGHLAVPFGAKRDDYFYP